MNLEGKTALVTGGTSGLGFAIAKKLLQKGAIVYILGRNAAKLEEAKMKLNLPNLHILHADVTEYKKLEQLVKKLDTIDILVNNAGVWLEGNIEENTQEEIESTIAINLTAVILVTKAVLPKMQEKKSGFILNISSTSGITARENQAVYCASKWGVTGFTKSLEKDFYGTNIKVAGLYPGGMNTKLFHTAGKAKPIDDWMDPEKVADVVIVMLEQDDTMLMSHVELNKRGAKYSFKK